MRGSQFVSLRVPSQRDCRILNYFSAPSFSQLPRFVRSISLDHRDSCCFCFSHPLLSLFLSIILRVITRIVNNGEPKPVVSRQEDRRASRSNFLHVPRYINKFFKEKKNRRERVLQSFSMIKDETRRA